MSPTLCVAGGEAAVAEAVVAVAEEAGREVRRLPAGGAPLPSEALIDLGLPPKEYPPGDALVRAEGDRAATLADRVPETAPVVRASVLGADAARGTLWQRAQGAAEDRWRERVANVVVLRGGVLLGPCGITAALCRSIERSKLVLLPGISVSKLEPLLLEDFARYCVKAALDAGRLDPVYDLGCGEILTGGLLARGLADNLGLRPWILPAPKILSPLVAVLLGTDEFPRIAVQRVLETIRPGLLPRRMNAWEHFDVEPVDLRQSLADATGMIVPVRPPGQGRFASWRKPTKKGILWRKKR